MARARFINPMSEKLQGLAEQVEKALRPAAHAGALVYYAEMRQRVPVDSGTLFGSIYRAHVDEKSDKTRQTYQIGPNISKAPHWHLVEFGHWLYNARAGNGVWLKSKSNPKARVKSPPSGHAAVHDLPGALETPVFVPAQPYIRSTYESHGGYALQAMSLRFAEVLKERGVIT